MKKTALTPFGRLVRKLRIDHDLLLKDMAEGVGLSSAWLSAIETGRKPIPKDLIRKITDYLDLELEEEEQLEDAAERSKGSYKLKASAPENRDVAAALARNFDELSDDDLNEIRSILNRRFG